MINLHDIHYMHLGTTNLESARRHATEILRQQITRAAYGAVYFRSEGRDHAL